MAQDLEGEGAHKERHSEWSQQECSDVSVDDRFPTGG